MTENKNYSKTAYSSEEFAKADLIRFQKHSNRTNIPTGYYKDVKTGFWHLTSNNKVLFDKIKVLEKENAKTKELKDKIKQLNKNHHESIIKIKKKYQKVILDELGIYISALNVLKAREEKYLKKAIEEQNEENIKTHNVLIKYYSKIYFRLKKLQNEYNINNNKQ